MLELFDNFNRDDTTNGYIGTAPSGQAWNLKEAWVGDGLPVATHGRILDGRFITDDGVTVYATQTLPEPVTRIGMKISLLPGTADTNSGVATMAISKTTNFVLEMAAHLCVSRNGWSLYVRDTNSFDVIANANFSTPLSTNGTAYPVEISVNGDTVTMNICGLLRTVRNTRIASVLGSNCFWEISYANSTNYSEFVRIESVWAGASPVGSIVGNVYSQPGTGFVGIGTTNPEVQLEVYGGATKFNNGSYNGYVGSGSVTVVGGGANDLALRADAGNMLFAIDALEKVRISTNGSVGIGTNAPSEKLEVAGNVKASGNLTVLGEASTSNFYTGDLFVSNAIPQSAGGTGLTNVGVGKLLAGQGTNLVEVTIGEGLGLNTNTWTLTNSGTSTGVMTNANVASFTVTNVLSVLGHDLAYSGTTNVHVDLSVGNKFRLNATNDFYLTFANVTDGIDGHILVVQDTQGASNTVHTSFLFNTNNILTNAPLTVNTGALDLTLFWFRTIGTNVYIANTDPTASVSGNYQPASANLTNWSTLTTNLLNSVTLNVATNGVTVGNNTNITLWAGNNVTLTGTNRSGFSDVVINSTTPLTTAGDLFYHDGTTTARLPIGPPGWSLIVNPFTGLPKWVMPLAIDECIKDTVFHTSTGVGGGASSLTALSTSASFDGQIRLTIYGTNGVGGTHYARSQFNGISLFKNTSNNFVWGFKFAPNTALTNDLLQAGWLGSNTTSNQTKGIFFEFNAAASANLVIKCIGTASTNFTTALTPALNTWTDAAMEGNSNSMVFYTNNVPCWTNTESTTLDIVSCYEAIMLMNCKTNDASSQNFLFIDRIYWWNY